TRPSTMSKRPDTSRSSPPQRTHPRPNAVADAITTSVPTVVIRLGRTRSRMKTRASGSISFAKPSRTFWGITFMVGGRYRDVTKLSIEQVLGAQAPKPREPPLPGSPHRFAHPAGENRATQLRAGRQPIEASIIEAQRIRLRRSDRPQRQDGGPRGIVPPPIRHVESDAAHLDLIILAV